MISNQNIFNNYFVNIGSSIEKNISKTKNGDIKDYLNNMKCDKTLFLVPVVTLEVEKAGPNIIPVSVLKVLKPFFSGWLAKLINLSSETAVFPGLRKIVPFTRKVERWIIRTIAKSPYYLCSVEFMKRFCINVFTNSYLAAIFSMKNNMVLGESINQNVL